MFRTLWNIWQYFVFLNKNKHIIESSIPVPQYLAQSEKRINYLYRNDYGRDIPTAKMGNKANVQKKENGKINHTG